MLFKFSVFLLVFCLAVLSIESGVLMSPIIIVELSAVLLLSVLLYIQGWANADYTCLYGNRQYSNY